MSDFVTIFYQVVFPILLMAGIGALLQRKSGLDIPTLTRLNFYVVIPALIYVTLVSTRFGGREIAKVMLFTFFLQVVLGLTALLIARLRRVPRDLHVPLIMSSAYGNAGNYGLPLQDLAFRPLGAGDYAMGLQSFVMITENLLGFTVGILMLSGAAEKSTWRGSLRRMLQFPPLYAIAAAWLTIQIRRLLGDNSVPVAEALQPFWNVLLHGRNAFVAVALCTMGAQLAQVSHGHRGMPITTGVILRLLVSPLIGLALVYLMGLQGIMAQALFISAGTPTAINVMLLCLQFDQRPDFASRAVFISTLLSPVTLTILIMLSRTPLIP